MVDYSAVPNDPGCYLYKDDKGKVIYIGKAKSLKKRVASYFTKSSLDPKTGQLVSNVASVDYMVTNSEVEALILETNLIKKYQPKYNVDLKDSKRYAYLEITKERFPRLLLARRRRKDGMYFGPFVSATERNYVRDIVIKTFQLRTCKRFPKKPCLRYHIGLCKAPCAGHISESAYDESVAMAREVLKGKSGEIISKLKEDMKRYSGKQMYEQALGAREQINALSYLQERQSMERQRRYDEDIINYSVRDGIVYLMLFNIHKGMLDNKQEFIFDATPNFFEDFLVQYYDEHDVPKELILPRKVDPSIQKLLESRKGQKVYVTVPKIGEKQHLLTLVKKNIDMSFFGDIEKVESLRKALKLNENPTVIECFDISHISGSATVGSMVQFRNGKPDKSNYRRFRIETVEGIDDFKAMAEVVRRRYYRLKKEKQPFPNLIVVDGGKGQLSSAMSVLEKLELKIPIIALAKKEEEVFFPGLSVPLKLDRKGTALRFLQQVRDEAHRFAIKYNRLLRAKKLFE